MGKDETKDGAGTSGRGMNQQTSFAQSEDARKKKTTRREKFLSQMEQVVPWARLVGVIGPHYPAGKPRRPPLGIQRLPPLYFLQQGFPPADEAPEDPPPHPQPLPTSPRHHHPPR